MSDTQRTATEQLLISNAIDQAVSQVDFRPLAGKSVYFDPQYLEGTVDRGYLVSSLRQHLLASGCNLQEERAKSTYVVEARSGGIGTDHHSLLIGVPQMTVPALVPGQPSQIPEIPVAKKNDEQGVAKIAVFAYNRQTGRRVWQSGIAESFSNARDTWVVGLGPFREGTIVHGTELAGEELPLPLRGEKDDKDGRAGLDVAPLNATAVWPEPAAKKGGTPVLLMLAQALLGDRLKPHAPAATAVAQGKQGTDTAKPVSTSAGAESKVRETTPNVPPAGIRAETAAPKVLSSGAAVLPAS
jgi:hypothetical protein